MNTTRPVFEELHRRGMIEQVTSEEGLRNTFDTPGAVVYVGFDPTAASLHVGHLLPVMALRLLQRQGHKPLVVIGGATGMIGDPSGRSTERPLLNREQVAENAAAIRRQLEHFLDFSGPSAALMLDNYEWLGKITHIDWLRDVGKHFSINYMLAKESVRRRLEDREHGISYTEFSYILLQAYDFLYLFDHYGCTVQAGGADQWGNITAGVDLIRKLRGKAAYGVTFPLLTTASGAKFGKSEGEPVWLDARKTTPYQFYQFWIRTEDADVDRYLRMFTLESLETIQEVCAVHRRHPERREAQKMLAQRITESVHGKDALHQAIKASEILFGKEIAGVSDADLSAIFADVPSVTLERQQLLTGLKLTELLVSAGACVSKAEAQRMIRGGGVYVNNRRVVSDVVISHKELASETTLVLRTGKKHYRLVRFV
jgi:tyrosyl-tRNA synthetase